VSATATATFDDVHLRIFDLSNSNDPVLILSAKTHRSPLQVPHPPQKARRSLSSPAPIWMATCVRLLFAHTDPRNLHISPHMSLIDAIDADGDGRGELLFRRISDAGTSYAIYRASRGSALAVV